MNKEGMKVNQKIMFTPYWVPIVQSLSWKLLIKLFQIKNIAQKYTLHIQEYIKQKTVEENKI